MHAQVHALTRCFKFPMPELGFAIVNLKVPLGILALEVCRFAEELEI